MSAKYDTPLWLRRRNGADESVLFIDVDSGEQTVNVPAGTNVWEEKFDSTSNRKYYWNPVTGKSVWTLKEVRTTQPSSNVATKSKDGEKEVTISNHVSESIPSQVKAGISHVKLPKMSPKSTSVHETTGWREMFDLETKRSFWFNDVTKESAWIKPSHLKPLKKGNPELSSKFTGENGSESGVWKSMTDATSGRVYFYNVETGESQWENPHNSTIARPDELRKSADASTFDAEKKIVTPEKYERTDSPWEILRDPKTNRVFFFNREDGRSQWERPEELLEKGSINEEENAASIEENKANWEELRDAVTNRIYYFNRINGRSQWTPPWKSTKPTEMSPSPPAKDPPITPREDKDNPSSVLDLTLGEGWSEVLDPATNKVFYYNSETGISQWVHPKRIKISKKSLKDEIDPEDVWCEIEDDSTKRTYFYNKLTGESRWTLIGVEVPSLSASSIVGSKEPKGANSSPEIQSVASKGKTVDGEKIILSSPQSGPVSGLLKHQPEKTALNGQTSTEIRLHDDTVVSSEAPNLNGHSSPMAKVTTETGDNSERILEELEQSTYGIKPLVEEQISPDAPRSFTRFVSPFTAGIKSSLSDRQDNNVLLAREEDDDRLMNIRKRNERLRNKLRTSMKTYETTTKEEIHPRTLAQGYLKKRARHLTRKGVSTWQKRYFILEACISSKQNQVTSSTLKYYKTDFDCNDVSKRPLGVIDFLKVQSISTIPSGDHGDSPRYDVNISGSSGLICTLRASEKSDLEGWLRAFNQVIAKFNEKSNFQRIELDEAPAEMAPPKSPPLLATDSDGSFFGSGSLANAGIAGSNEEFSRASFLSTGVRGFGNQSSDELGKGKVVGEVKALCVRSYAAREDNELSFAQGDTIVITDMHESKRWWTGKSQNGKQGRFLPSYVRILQEGAFDQSTTTTEPKWKIWCQSFLESLPGGIYSRPASGIGRKFSDIYPVFSVLHQKREHCSLLNHKIHKVKSEVRGLQWLLNRAVDSVQGYLLIESEDIRRMVTEMKLSSPAALSASNKRKLNLFGQLVHQLHREPKFFVSMTKSLNEEAQQVIATMIVNSLLDNVSVSDELLVNLIKEALKAEGQSVGDVLSLRCDCLPTVSSPVFSRGASSQWIKIPSMTDIPGSFTAALLLALTQREDVQEFLQGILMSVAPRVISISESEIRAPIWESVLVVVVPSQEQRHQGNSSEFSVSSASLEIMRELIGEMKRQTNQIPNGLKVVFDTLATSGGDVLVWNFLVNVLLFSIVTHRCLYNGGTQRPGGTQADLSLDEKAIQMFQTLQALNEYPGSNVQYRLFDSDPSQELQYFLNKGRGLIDGLVAAVLEVSKCAIRPSDTDAIQQGSRCIVQRPEELSNLIVTSCFELYLLHMSVFSYLESIGFETGQSEESESQKLSNIIARLGPPMPLNDSEAGNPYFTLRMQNEVTVSNGFVQTSRASGITDKEKDLIVTVRRMVRDWTNFSSEEAEQIIYQLERVEGDIMLNYSELEILNSLENTLNLRFEGLIKVRDILVGKLKESLRFPSSIETFDDYGMTMEEIESPVKSFKPANHSSDEMLESKVTNRPNQGNISGLLAEVFSNQFEKT